jgi:hypothetical protein
MVSIGAEVHHDIQPETLKRWHRAGFRPTGPIHTVAWTA